MAVPVSYTVKNLNNQVIGQKSKKTQTIASKIAVLAPSNNILKVTITDIQSIKARDKDRKDDFGIQQYIVFRALGKEKKYVSREINKFSTAIDERGQAPGIINPLIMGGEQRQIHVKAYSNINSRNRMMIDNSLVFHITSDELNDPYASFEIFTWLKEYTTLTLPPPTFTKNVDRILMNNTPVKVKIKDVIEILQGRKNLEENSTIPKLGIVPEVRFHNFGSDFMKLANIRKKEPLVLEGPIYFAISSVIVGVWVQFELIE